jgi:hypothetical protein
LATTAKKFLHALCANLGVWVTLNNTRTQKTEGKWRIDEKLEMPEKRKKERKG